ncbi:MAG: cystathionine gamma-synthase family protein [Acidimicrobiia bacterium]|nr:cystathionine gamma-synthase family protein [Acidimicrobiia bacterium]
MSDEYRKKIGEHELSPESLMMGYAYRPEWSEGALKSPIFQTSTFTFSSAAEGRRFFEIAYGLDEADPGENTGLIYSRLNNPDLEILEQRLTLWDGAEAGLVFASGMAAITTTMLTFVQPGTVVVHSAPVYGGTDHFLHETLARLGVERLEWDPGTSIDDLDAAVDGRRIALVFLETPANPTNDLFSIAEARAFADRHSTEDHAVPLVVDNTFLGPLWQHPIDHGADLVLYSATKFIGGHSDLIAGAALGRRDLIDPIAELRTILGTMATPLTGWLMMRSLETLALRMRRQADNAQVVADFLDAHPKVSSVGYLGFIEEGDPAMATYRSQCLGPGSMISFWIDTDLEGAFRFLDSLQLIHLAVSLGSTESLIEHPATMTHAGVDPEERAMLGITDQLVRLSVGVENPDDLIVDLASALDKI